MAALRNVEVVVADDLKFRQQRIAMVAMRVDRIATVGELRPDAVGEEFVLRHVRPVTVVLRVAFVSAVNLLQEYDIGAHAAHRFTQLGQNETSIQRSEALVDIDRQHREARDGDAGGNGHPVGNRSHDCSCERVGAWPPFKADCDVSMKVSTFLRTARSRHGGISGRPSRASRARHTPVPVGQGGRSRRSARGRPTPPGRRSMRYGSAPCAPRSSRRPTRPRRFPG